MGACVLRLVARSSGMSQHLQVAHTLGASSSHVDWGMVRKERTLRNWDAVAER